MRRAGQEYERRGWEGESVYEELERKGREGKIRSRGTGDKEGI